MKMALLPTYGDKNELGTSEPPKKIVKNEKKGRYKKQMIKTLFELLILNQ